jgi:hypothetical protein
MLFRTTGIYMTNGVQASIESKEITHEDIGDCLNRHFMNLGDECKEDNKLNEVAIKMKEGRVLSVFKNIGDTNNTIYIITEGFHLENDPKYGFQYPMTTVLFSDEY